MIFSLLLILLLSLAVVSAEDLESTDSVGDAQISDSDVYLVDSDSSDTINQAIAIEENSENNDIDDSDILDSSEIDYKSDNLKAVADVNYSISVKNISATENTNVTIIANVKNYDTPVEFGYVLFSLWDNDGQDIREIVPVENGQAVLKIKLNIPIIEATSLKMSIENSTCHTSEIIADFS